MKANVVILPALVLLLGCVSRDGGVAGPDPKLERLLRLEARIDELEVARAYGFRDEDDIPTLMNKQVDEYRSWDFEKGRDPTKEERAAITAVVQRKARYPILSITVCGKRRAVVDTGVIRGTLDGNGQTFYLIKEPDGWRIAFLDFWLS